jgi:hypothetical protein
VQNYAKAPQRRSDLGLLIEDCGRHSETREIGDTHRAARYLPSFLATIQILQTFLWKWIGLILGTLFSSSSPALSIGVAAPRGAVCSHAATCQGLLAPDRGTAGSAPRGALPVGFRARSRDLRSLGDCAFIHRAAGTGCFCMVSGLVPDAVGGIRVGSCRIAMDPARRFASRFALHLG